MAHVLLPCDLPNWSDIQRNLAPLKVAKDADQLVQGMSKIYDMCCISLEPEDLHQPKDSAGTRFEELKNFVEGMTEEDQSRFFNETLPNLVSQALCICLAKPPGGFLYCLKREEEKFQLDRGFIKSLLANAFFSTFPKRTPKTHPCLQNFSFCDFFQHLSRRSHQKKLKAFLRYFQRGEDRRKSLVRIHRKVLSGKAQPSLPGWLCSDRPLIPLIVRQDGNIHNAEQDVCRAFPCSSLVGGDVLQAAAAPESSLFFAFPELMCCLSFVEELESNEALFISSVIPHGIHKSRQGLAQEVDICLMDSITLVAGSDQQFEDRSLLRELNKGLATFGTSSTDVKIDDDDVIDISQRRQTPVGESSSSEQPSTASSRRASEQPDESPSYKQIMKSPLDKVKESKKGSYLPLIPRSESSSDSYGAILAKSTYTKSKSCSGEFPKLPTQSSNKKISHSLRNSTSSGHSSTRSGMRTASESSVELPLITRPTITSKTGDDEYYTADEDSDRCPDGKKARDTRRRNSGSKVADLSALILSTAGLVDEKPSKQMTKSDETGRRRGSGNSSIPCESKDSSRDMSFSQRSDSAGFVLGGMGSQEDDFVDEDEENGDRGPPIHERLEDFRRRIRRRTRRHLSKKMRSSSRSSYSFGSSSSSDMEDISEEEDTDDSFQYHPQIMRASNSEPSLASLNDEAAFMSLPPISMTSDTVMLMLSGRRVVVTSSNGALKAYSYDGVNPNLPVPFKAKFRTRRARHPSEGCISDNLDDYLPARLLELGSERNNSFTDSDEEGSRPSRLSSLSSFAQQTQSSVSYDDEIVCRNRGNGPRCPIAVGPSRQGDPQLRALILWLAASMAGLPSLIFYTGHEFQLYELSTVYRRVLARHWTVGDLSCELLRFCRNRLSPRRNSCCSSIFEQLLCSGVSSLVSTPLSLRQHSLD